MLIFIRHFDEAGDRKIIFFAKTTIIIFIDDSFLFLFSDFRKKSRKCNKKKTRKKIIKNWLKIETFPLNRG